MDHEVGVALSIGGAASMAQVGVLEELEAAGIRPRFVAGSSAGALVGGAYAAGCLTPFRDLMASLTRRRVMMMLFDPTWTRSGLLRGKRCLEFVRDCLGERIENLPVPYAAVATDVHTGEEIVLRHGDVIDAVRASLSVPGIFAPQIREGRFLVDGGVASPIPVRVARDLGSRFVIGVSVLDFDPKAGFTLPPMANGETAAAVAEVSPVPVPPALIEVIFNATRVAAARLAAAQLRESPADFLLHVEVPRIGLFDFHRSEELVEIGRAAARRALPELRSALEGRRSTGFARKIRRMLGPAAFRPQTGHRPEPPLRDPLEARRSLPSRFARWVDRSGRPTADRSHQASAARRTS